MTLRRVSCCQRCGRSDGYFARDMCNPCYQKARKRGEFKLPSDNHERADMSGDRCRCGLRLPCNDCLPLTATEFLFTRMYPEER